MSQLIEQGVFGSCQRVACQMTYLLPIGTHAQKIGSFVHLFCPSCNEVYKPYLNKHQKIDGCFYGQHFPQMFYMMYPNSRPNHLSKEKFQPYSCLPENEQAANSMDCLCDREYHQEETYHYYKLNLSDLKYFFFKFFFIFKNLLSCLFFCTFKFIFLIKLVAKNFTDLIAWKFIKISKLKNEYLKLFKMKFLNSGFFKAVFNFKFPLLLQLFYCEKKSTNLFCSKMRKIFIK